MGFKDWFVEPPGVSMHEIPSTPGQTEARGSIMDSMRKDIKHPTQQVAPLTKTEMGLQSQANYAIDQSQSDYDLTRSYYQDILKGNFNPQTSSYYEGFRTLQDTQKDKAQQQIKRQGQGAGMNKGLHTAALEAQTGLQYDAVKQQELGRLELAERDAQDRAAAGLPAATGQRMQTILQGQTMAQIEREQQDRKNTAMYTTAMNDILAPYVYNAQLALAIMGEQRYISQETGGGATDLGFGVQMASSFMTGMAGKPA